MELNWLEDFISLAEHLNFSKAAQARNVTQPAFSRRIRALEQWVGALLFSRTTHEVSLTPAGKHFQTQAATLARGLHQLRRETHETASGKGGVLSFAATHALSFAFFPAWIRSSERMLSSGPLNLISDSMAACEQLMMRGDAQFLLCHYHPDTPSWFETGQFKSVVVGHDTLVPLCACTESGAPKWPLNGELPANFLAYSDQSGLGRIISNNWIARRRSFNLEKVFTSHLAATLLSMARAGDGVAWLPQTLSQDDITAGRLVRAGGPELEIPVEIRVFRPASRQTTTIKSLWSYFEQQSSFVSENHGS